MHDWIIGFFYMLVYIALWAWVITVILRFLFYA